MRTPHVKVIAAMEHSPHSLGWVGGSLGYIDLMNQAVHMYFLSHIGYCRIYLFDVVVVTGQTIQPKVSVAPRCDGHIGGEVLAMCRYDPPLAAVNGLVGLE